MTTKQMMTLLTALNKGSDSLMSATPHGAFLCIKPLPCSSYSAFDIHICWKDPRDAKMDPPGRSQ